MTENAATRLLITAVVAVVSGNAPAAEWTFSESITLSEAYTDNVELSENNPEGSWATIISPNVLFSGKGRRMSVELAAALQIVTNADQNFFPQLRGTLNTELIKKRFFVDAFVTADQQTIDPLRPAGTPINRTGNLTTTYAIGINPYWVERFGDLADLRVDYEYRHEFFNGGDNEPDDRDYNNVYFTLDNGRRFGALDWGLRGSYEHTTYQNDSASNTTFKSLDLRLGYAVTRSLSPYVSVGREWNTYETTRSRKGGDKWLVGAVWTPNPRVSLDAGYGYRFFGHYPFVNFSYRHRRSVFRLSYTEDIESGYQPLDQQNILATSNLAGNPINPFTGNPGAITSAAGTNGFLQNGAYVDKRFHAAYLLQGRRTSFGIDANYSDKSYAAPTPGILEWEVGLNVNRKLGRVLSADARASWNRVEDDSDFQSDTWDLGFGIDRQLGSNTHLRFSYTYSQRDSNRPDDDYTENRFALVLNTSMVGLAKHAGF